MPCFLCGCDDVTEASLCMKCTASTFAEKLFLIYKMRPQNHCNTSPQSVIANYLCYLLSCLISLNKGNKGTQSGDQFACFLALEYSSKARELEACTQGDLVVQALQEQITNDSRLSSTLLGLCA